MCQDGTEMVRTLWIMSRRKKQLFAMACARRALLIADDPRCENILQATEAYLDGHVTQEELQSVRDSAWDCYHEQSGTRRIKQPSQYGPRSRP